MRIPSLRYSLPAGSRPVDVRLEVDQQRQIWNGFAAPNLGRVYRVSDVVSPGSGRDDFLRSDVQRGLAGDSLNSACC